MRSTSFTGANAAMALPASELASGGATLLSADSEYDAIFQVFDFDRRESIERIILAASGGHLRLGRSPHHAGSQSRASLRDRM